jgi:aspartyl-tRNA(Asn)/glutamyl-tRNA(Gln) amidotransferase subunit C
MAEQISKEQVRNIAKLANISLTDSEVEKYSRQLSEVIDYNVFQLNKVNTEKIEPLLNVSGLTNSFRDDKTEPGLSNDEVLSNASEKHNGFIKVKAVLDQ